MSRGPRPVMPVLRVLRVLGAGLAGCILLVRGPGAPVVVFNATASAPIGFYRVDRTAPAVGDRVVVWPPAELAQWMALRGYLPRHVPLIKPLAALGGQRVCGSNGTVFIDGRDAARALPTDRLGRPLRAFEGCRRLRTGEVFLLNAAEPYSLDGRYFGPVGRSAVLGRATPIWTRGGA